MTQMQTTKANMNRLYQIRKNQNFTFRVKPNKFIGMNFNQFKQMYTGNIPQAPKPTQKYYKLTDEEIPDELDLRVKGITTPVKDQAVCGSCWTFATAGVIEGRINMLHRFEQKPLIRASEQQVLSCTWLDDVDENNNPMKNLGCNGGETNLALDQIIKVKNGRIPLESKAPYLGIESQCDDDAWTDQYGHINETIMIDPTLSVEEKTRQLKQALKGGPVAVSIAVTDSMSFYDGGVFNDPACGEGKEAELVHAVLCVGYGTDAEYGDYWIIKNSWSNAWGQDGYIYISQKNDLCGVLQAATFFEIDQNVTPSNPVLDTSFVFKGTFSLPYANVTQDIQVWYDEATKREKISWFDDADYTVWNLDKETDKFYSVITYQGENKTESE